MHHLANLLFFDISLLYYYTKLNSLIICCLSFGDIYLIFLMLILIYTYFLGTNLSSSMICCLSSGDMYLFLWVAFSTSSSVSLFGNSLVGFFRDACYFISNFIVNQITSCSCCFLNCSFWSSFYCICCRFFSTIKKFLTIFIA